MYEVTEEIPKVKWYLDDPYNKKEKEASQVLFDVVGPFGLFSSELIRNYGFYRQMPVFLGRVTSSVTRPLPV
jgi:hypothetical protein